MLQESVLVHNELDGISDVEIPDVPFDLIR